MKRVALSAGVTTLAAGMMLGTAVSAADVPSKMVFTSYDFGSSGFAQASGIANAFKKKHNTRIRIIPSGTSIGRMLPLAQRKADYAFLASGTFFGSEGTYDFANPDWGPQDLRVVLAPPAATGIVMLGNSKFKDAKSIKGMRIGYVKGNPSVNVKNDGILAFAGLTQADIEPVWHGGYGVMKTALLTGKIDGFLAAPTSGFSREIEASPNGISWLQFDPNAKENWDRMVQVAPMYAPWRETAGAGMSEDNPQDVLSFRYPMMVTYAERSDDEVYNIIKAMDELYPEYKDVSAAAKFWDIKYSGLPPAEAAFHPAAVKYLKEKGVWTPEAQSWNEKRTARHEAVIEAWDDAQESFTAWRAEERKKGNKIKTADAWPDYWAKARKDKGLD